MKNLDTLTKENCKIWSKHISDFLKPSPLDPLKFGLRNQRLIVAALFHHCLTVDLHLVQCVQFAFVYGLGLLIVCMNSICEVCFFVVCFASLGFFNLFLCYFVQFLHFVEKVCFFIVYIFVQFIFTELCLL